MDSNKLILLFNTVKYLKFKQVYYRIYYFFRNRFFKKKYNFKLKKDITPIIWSDVLYNKKSYSKESGFTFLNINHKFIKSIDWNISSYGKLWTYNLTYFDFLNQNEIDEENGVELINNYIDYDSRLLDGKEPYPISLRGINWIKFLSKNNIKIDRVNEYLYNDYLRLVDNREYHLLANHLLENGLSLFFGAYYFQDEKLYVYAKDTLLKELNEQILKDGAHYELSPMYHQIILHRIFDCINLNRLNRWKDDEVISLLYSSSQKMLGWLEEVTYKNGNIPMVADSTYDIAPNSNELFDYAKKLEILSEKITLKNSGYRKIEKNNIEFFYDIGNIQPSYQPGHTHADTFSFELYYQNNPVIVDPGISTYEKNELRNRERSTIYHNTVTVNKSSSSEVWGGFRVANRAKVTYLVEDKFYTLAKHDGFLSKYKTIHTREFDYRRNSLKIADELETLKNEARFHLHPNYNNIYINENIVRIEGIDLFIEFEGGILNIIKGEYDYCVGFNKTKKAIYVQVEFDKRLTTYFETK